MLESITPMWQASLVAAEQAEPGARSNGVEWLQQSAIHDPRCFQTYYHVPICSVLSLMRHPLTQTPPSQLTLTYMQRSLNDMDVKCIHLSIDMQLFAVMKQVCWYQPMQFKNVVVHLRWLHCKAADEEFRARSVRGCSIRRTDWYYKGNITIITRYFQLEVLGESHSGFSCSSAGYAMESGR